MAHVYCGQTAAWIKVPPGTEVGLGPDHIVIIIIIIINNTVFI